MAGTWHATNTGTVTGVHDVGLAPGHSGLSPSVAALPGRPGSRTPDPPIRAAMELGSSRSGAADYGSFGTSRLVLRGDGTVACGRPVRVTVVEPVWPGVLPGPGSSPGLPGSAAAGAVTAIAATRRRWVPAVGAARSLQLGPERLAGPGAGWPPGTRAGVQPPDRWPGPAACPQRGGQGPVNAIAEPSWRTGRGPGAAPGRCPVPARLRQRARPGPRRWRLGPNVPPGRDVGPQRPLTRQGKAEETKQPANGGGDCR